MLMSFRPFCCHRDAPPTASSSLRTEARPPALSPASDSLWDRALVWLMAPAPQLSTLPFGPLQRVSKDFLAAIDDLRTPDAIHLRSRLSEALTLRDFWHLRADAFHLVAIAHGQQVAEQRLATLNRHFPKRAPRSSFLTL